VPCGSLQCSNVTHLPQLQEHVGFHPSEISGLWCLGLDSHHSTGTIKIGHVRTGTSCAPGKFCQDTYCTGSVAKLNYDFILEKCSHRGMCNNNRKCHCHISTLHGALDEALVGAQTVDPSKKNAVRQANSWIR
ncbi:disintegrin and metalloproteinase, partial [Lynx pardinus]